MKPRFSLLFLMLCCFTSMLYAQTTIDNTLTEEHVFVPGTRFALLPPDASFEASSEYKGFENETLDAGIKAVEVPLTLKMMRGTLKKGLAKKKGRVLLDKDLIMNGYTAKLYKLNNRKKTTKAQFAASGKRMISVVEWVLLYGNEDLCLMVTGIYGKEKDGELSAKFEKSLMSFLYTSKRKIDPLGNLSFHVKTSDTPLKFAEIYKKTGASFDLDGKRSSKKGNAVRYIVEVIPSAVGADKQEEEAVKLVKNETTELGETNPIEINGLKGFEVIGYDKKSGESTLSYGATLFDAEKYYTIKGYSQKDFEKNMEVFRKVTSTFKLKK
ncbi:MAG: hypothetical protein AB8B69_03485 [Chitinophagales bacterium]